MKIRGQRTRVLLVGTILALGLNMMPVARAATGHASPIQTQVSQPCHGGCITQISGVQTCLKTPENMTSIKSDVPLNKKATQNDSSQSEQKRVGYRPSKWL